MGGELSDKVAISMDDIQGCVTAPLLFIVILLAITILASDPQDPAGVRLRYTLDGGAFRL